MSNEAEIEQMITDAGKTSPRLTPADIDACIVNVAYHRFEGTTVTVCCLTLRNGFNVIGESAAASPSNFDDAIGKKIAHDNARNKIWALEGYLLKQRLSEPDDFTLPEKTFCDASNGACESCQ